MVTAYSRGHKIYFDSDGVWKYVDTNTPDTNYRPCARCNRPPTKEGYDACLGKIEGVTSACCGHGVEEPYCVKEA